MPHFRIEEEHLLPGLEALGEGALAERIRADHAELRRLADGGPVDPARLRRFGERLRDHIRFEEREVLESSQHRLPAAVLEAIASACEAIPRACPTFLSP